MNLRVALLCAAAAQLYCSLTGAAYADEFAERCALLSQQRTINVAYRDSPVASDATRSTSELNRIGGVAAGEYHNIYGMTFAKPQFVMQVTPRAFIDADGRICALPEIAIQLGFSAFAVYLAKELLNPCHREVIREHEQEHVTTWKSHLRASAQLLATVLQQNRGEARIYASREETEAGVQAWARELVAPWSQRVLQSVEEAQKSIDTQVSYDRVTSRLRACARTMR